MHKHSITARSTLSKCRLVIFYEPIMETIALRYADYMRTIAKRLTDGQDLMVEIKKLLDEQGVKAGVILSAVGSLKQSTIRVPVIERKVKYIHPENLEIDSMRGPASRC